MAARASRSSTTCATATRCSSRLLAGRLKAIDVERTGWASLCVMGHEPPFPSATFSGPAKILTEDIGTATATIMQRIAGLPEPPEPQSDAALAEIGRVILRIEIEKVASVSYVDEAG